MTSILQQYMKDYPDHAHCAVTTWKDLDTSNHSCTVARHLEHLHPNGCLPPPTLTIVDIY